MKNSNQSPQRFVYTLMLGLIVIVIYFNYFQTANKSILQPKFYSNVSYPSIETESVYNKSSKYILYYTTFFKYTDFGIGEGKEPFRQFNCQVQDCYLTSNKSLLPMNQYDALLFHIRNLKKSLPDASKRNPHQRYIMFLMESPVHDYYNYAKLKKGFFNWTMTYRSDSDIPIPYGNISPSHAVDPASLTDANNWVPSEAMKLKLQKKTKLVLWMVSNCKTDSKREAYVQELQKHIAVDIIGGCGTRKCSKTDITCVDSLVEEYKFYLSFENSICNGYVTEKFFGKIQYDILPITLGGANYSAISPPHSFIDTRDFASPKKLAEYLLHLDKNDEEYASYFWWKDKYIITNSRQVYEQSFCNLCKMLHDPLQAEKSYLDIKKWWIDQSHCASGHH